MQDSSSKITPEINDVATTEESFVLHNSDSKKDPSTTFNNAIETSALLEVKKQHTFIHWEMELQKQDAIWQKMFEQNWQLDLYSLCSKYFREVKQDFGDDKLFQQWFEKQKKTYPHRTTYQRIKL